MPKKILKWPMIIVGGIVFIVSLIGLLTSVIGSYSTGTYKFAGKVKDDYIKMEITLESDGTGLFEFLVDYESKDLTTEIERAEIRYQVYEDELYIGEEYYGYTSYDKVGEISLFKLEMKVPGSDNEIVLKNNSATAKMIISIVFVVISVVMLFIGIASIVISKMAKKATVEMELTNNDKKIEDDEINSTRETLSDNE